VLLSQRAAKRIGVDVGQKVLIETRNGEDGEGWRGGVVVGVLADGKWKPGLPEMILPYFSAQQVDAERLNARAHELVLIPGEGVEPSTLVAAARESLSPLVRPWQQIAPDMARLIETQDTWVGIMLFIIFAIAALTVMNTMLMAVFERTREFGVLKSIGMKPRQVFGLIVIETAGLALIATVVGGALGVALDHYLVVHGLDLSAFTGGFTYQGTFISPVWRAVYTVKSIFLPIAMVALVCLLVSFYPAMRAGRLSPVDALHHTG
jgi:ABC-type lipoprotein release transport system permease subunit